MERKRDKLFLTGINILSQLNKHHKLEVAFKFDNENDEIEIINELLYYRRELKNKEEIKRLNLLFSKIYKYELFQVILNE